MKSSSMGASMEVGAVARLRERGGGEGQPLQGCGETHPLSISCLVSPDPHPGNILLLAGQSASIADGQVRPEMHALFRSPPEASSCGMPHPSPMEKETNPGLDTCLVRPLHFQRTLGLIDYGQVKKLAKEDRLLLAHMLLGLGNLDHTHPTKKIILVVSK